MPKKAPVYTKPCPRPECGVPHNPMKRCADGVKRFTYNSNRARQAPRRKAIERDEPGKVEPERVKEAAAVAPGPPPQPEPAVEYQNVNGILIPKDPNAIAEIVAEHARLKAAEEHAAAEAAAGRMLPLPTILRSRNDKAAESLLSAVAGVERKQVEWQTGRPTPESLAATGDVLRKVTENRDDATAKARVAKAPSVVRAPGDFPWRCTKCNTRFRSLSIEGVRRKAKAEPNWKLVCPACGAPNVLQEEEAA